jgi:hypothetical protein
MFDEIKKAIKALTDKAIATDDALGNEALKYSQAALNLAHTAQVLRQVELQSQPTN